MKKLKILLIAVFAFVVVAFIGCVAVFAATPIDTANIGTTVKGDIDGNSSINVDDAIYLLRHTLMPERYPIGQSGDINRDGVTNVDDAIYLLRHTLMPDRYPIECDVHTPETIPAVEPKCEETGLTEGSKCADCGEILVAQEEVPATGHNVHTVEVIGPSCSEGGYTLKACDKCDTEYRTEPVAALGHDYGEYAATTPESCEGDGTYTRTCSVCGEVDTKTISAHGHDYATDRIDGEVLVVICSHCGDEKRVSDISQVDDTTDIEVDCSTDYTFVVVCPEGEDYLRDNITVSNPSYAEDDENEDAVPELEITELGDGRYEIKPIGGYQPGTCYEVSVGEGVELEDHDGESFKFVTEYSGEKLTDYNDGIIFIKLPSVGDPERDKYKEINSEAEGKTYFIVPDGSMFDEHDVGTIICVGDYSNAEEIAQNPGKECSFGKIEDIEEQPDGSCVLVLIAPEVEEIYDELVINVKEFLAVSDEDIPQNIEEELVEVLLSGNDFSEFLASVQIASNEYAENKGVVAVADASSLLQNISFKPNVTTKDGKIVASVAGSVKVQLKTRAGKVYGSIEVSFLAQAVAGYDFAADVEFGWRRNGIKELDISVTQTTDYTFNFKAAINMEYSLDDDRTIDPIYKTPNGIYHLGDCTKINMYDPHQLAAYSAEEAEEIYRANWGRMADCECKSCKPFTKYLNSQIYVVNSTTKTVHCFGCDSGDRFAVANVTIAKTLPDAENHTYCTECKPQSAELADFESRMLNSIEYADWQKVVDEIKKAVRDRGIKPETSKRLYILDKPIPVAYVFEVGIQMWLELDFKLQGSIEYNYAQTITNVYGIRYVNEPLFKSDHIDTYRECIKGPRTQTLKIVGNVDFKMGINARVFISFIGLDDYMYADINAKGGVYLDLDGLYYFNQTGDTTDDYGAICVEVGLYYDIKVGYRVFDLSDDYSFFGGEKKFPLIFIGHDKVFYNYATNDVTIETTGNSVDLDKLQLLKGKCFDVRNTTSSTEILSIKGVDGKYKVIVKVTDKDGNPHTYCTFVDGKLVLSPNAPCDITVYLSIDVEGTSKVLSGVWETGFVPGNTKYMLDTLTATLHITNHTTTDWIVLDEPGCTTEGERYFKYTCDCVDPEGNPLEVHEAIPELGHDTIHTPAVKVTCTTDGYTESYHCDRCQEVFVERVLIPMLGHRYLDPFTCHDRECQNDGCEYVDIATTPHVFSDWLQVDPDECSVVSYKVRYCKDCRAVDFDFDGGDEVQHPHDLYFETEINATCTEGGHYVLKCRECDKVVAEEFTEPNGHNMSDYRFTAEGHYKECLTWACHYTTEITEHYFNHDCDTDCNICGYERVTEHRFDKPAVYDAESHWYVCSICSAKTTREAHYGGTATCTEKALCELCGGHYGDKKPHNYIEKFDEQYLSEKATCEEPARYYKSCSECGAAHGHNTFEYGDALGHDWNEEYNSDTTYHWIECKRTDCRDNKNKQEHLGGTATCTEKASCEICGREYGNKLAHEYTETVDEEYLAEKATCETKAKYYKSCSMCGLTHTTEKFEYGEALHHDWNLNEYKYSESYHWYGCNREGCTAQNGREAHSGGTATCTEKAVCEDCGQPYGSKSPSHSRNNNVYDRDEHQHWHPCTVCGDMGEKTDHNFVSVADEDYIVNAATCEKGTEYYKSCVCGAVSTETFFDTDKLGHAWGEYVHDAENHWKECTRTNCNAKTEPSAHSGGTATCVEKATCGTCGQQYGELSANHDLNTAVYEKDEHQHWHVCRLCTESNEKNSHVFIEKKDSAYLAAPATCEKGTEYYKSCVCGAVSTETFFDTDKLGHAWGEYLHDAESHWKECTRTNCDVKTEQSVHSGGTATCAEKAICDVCEQPYGELGTEHKWSTSYNHDSEGHWRECTLCGTPEEAVKHSGGTATCAEKTICSVCEQPYGELGTEHKWGNTYEHNAEGHWRTCVLCESPEAIQSHSGGEATCVDKAKCSDCKQYYGNVLGHDPNTDEYNSDSTHHWHECKREGCNVRIDEAAHSGGEATCTTFASCEFCGVQYGQKAEHNFVIPNESDSYAITFTGCLTEGEYYYSCACGQSSNDRSLTFKTAPYGSHKWGAKYYASSETDDVVGHYRICERVNCRQHEGVTSHIPKTPASCTERALCEVCDVRYGDYLEHNYNQTEPLHLAKEADCVNAAKYYYYCACGEKSSETFTHGNALGHLIDEAVWSFSEGQHYHKCSRTGCNHIEGAQSHNMSGFTETLPPSCSEEGKEQSDCSICDYFEERPITKLPHDWEYELTKQSESYVKNGETVSDVIIYNKCRVCGEVEEIARSDGHIHVHEQYTKIIFGKAPTCTEDGLTAGAICDAPGCGEVLIEQTVIPKLGHIKVESTYNVYLKSKATCTSPATYYHSCERCHDALDTEFTVGQELGHDFDETKYIHNDTNHWYKCKNENCQEQMGTAQHGFDNACDTTCDACGYTRITEHRGGTATCTKKAVCETCGSEYGDYLEHNFNQQNTAEAYLKTKADCDSAAEYYYSCVCGEKGSEAFIYGEKTGHSYKNGACEHCGEPQPDSAELLKFTLSNDGTYYSVTGHTIAEKTVVVIPSTYEGLPVKEIGAGAFRNCSYITGVVIPEGVTNIWGYAFEKCANLVSAELPYGLESIGMYSFGSCNKLADFKLPETLKSIDSNAFYGTAITTVTVPNSVVSIGTSAFSNCTLLESVTLGTGLTSLENNVFYSCTKLTEIDIPNTVISIGNNAFNNCTSLKTVSIGNGVTTIGSNAFFNCSSLETVRLGYRVATIGDSAFNGCSKLSGINLSQGVTTIGSNAFYNCKTLSGISLGKNVNLISFSAFAGCSGLEYIIVAEDNTVYLSSGNCLIKRDTMELVLGCKASVIPDGVKSIGMVAFNGCKGLVSINIPEGVTSIGNSAFNGCTSLTGIVIPDSVTSIGNYAFRGCSKLASVVLSKNISTIPAECFAYCPRLTSVEIPNNVTSIANMAFYECIGLQSVAIPNSVKSIGANAFYGCTDLYNITIPDSVVTIGSGAFRYCSALEVVTLGYGVESIAVNAFASCTKISDVYYAGSESDAANITIGTGNNYLTNAVWHYAKSDDPLTYSYDDTTLTATVSGCVSTATDITIPDTVDYNGKVYTVTAIGKEAFYNLADLRTVVFGDNIKTIGESAFSNCKALYYIGFGMGLVDIGDSAFNYCTKLEYVYLPDSVERIGASAFNYCTTLVSVEHGDNITEIGANAFNRCVKLQGFEIPSKLKRINDNTFSGCSVLTGIVIPDGVTSIGSGAFNGCRAIKEINLGSAITELGSGCFAGCNSLEAIIIPNKVQIIGSKAFQNCTKLVSVTIGTGVTFIDSYAFANCTALVSIVIPDNVQTIGENVFEGCSAFDTVTLGIGITEIGKSAFNKCTKLANVYYAGSESDAENITIGTGNNYLTNAVWEYYYPLKFSCSSLTGTAMLKETKIKAVTSVVIPSTVTFSGESYTVTAIGLSNNIFGFSGFSGCTSLKSVVIPNSITSIGDGAFDRCYNLTDVYYQGTPDDQANIAIGSYNDYLLNATWHYI